MKFVFVFIDDLNKVYDADGKSCSIYSKARDPDVVQLSEVEESDREVEVDWGIAESSLPIQQ